MYRLNQWRVRRSASSLFWNPVDVEEHNKRVAQEFGWDE
jgi:hypothetical protein